MKSHHPRSKEGAPRSPRQLKVAEEMRHTLAAVLMEGDFPWKEEFPRPVISLTEVRISPDLRNAALFVMPLGGKHRDETVKALQAAAHFFKNELAHRMQLRYLPELRFMPDESFDYAAKIDTLLHKPEVVKDLHGDNEADE